MDSISRRPRLPLDLMLNRVFLSASIPTATRWPHPFDSLEVTEAVLAVVRGVIAAHGVILYGGHPAIAPLVLRVAAAFQEQIRFEEPPVVVYQSELYADQFPTETMRLVTDGLGTLNTVPSVAGEAPLPGHNARSLAAMREAMLNPRQKRPVAAVFVGGMEGIAHEYQMFQERFPGVPTYPLGGAGGMATQLPAHHLDDEPSALFVNALHSSRAYASLVDSILFDIIHRGLA